MSDTNALAALLDALRPWHEKIVFVGGWAHRLHRLHASATAPRYEAIVTKDADVAFASHEQLQGDMSKALADAQFTKRLSGDARPPVSHFHFGDETSEFYAEFLTPLSGSGYRRDGSADETVEVAGVTAQKLRHLEILLVAPWLIEISPSDAYPLSAATTIRVANPVSFMVQKLLIHSVRAPEKRPQDVLYLHDTVELFERSLPLLKSLWNERVAPTLSAKQRTEVPRQIQEMFGSETDTLRSAADIPKDRQLNTNEMRIKCEFGLKEILL